MAFDLARIGNGITLVLACDNLRCRQLITCSRDTVLIHPCDVENPDPGGMPDYFVTCSTECAAELRQWEDLDAEEWTETAFVLPMAELVVRADYLPPGVGGERYLTLIRTILNRPRSEPSTNS